MKAKLVTADGCIKFLAVPHLQTTLSFVLSKPVKATCFEEAVLCEEGFGVRNYEFTETRDGDGAYVYREILP